MNDAQQATLPASYAEFNRSFIVRRLGILLGVGIVAWSTYLARDIAAFGRGSEPATYRLAGALILLATLMVHRSRLVRRYLSRHPQRKSRVPRFRSQEFL